jgi:hypothetical protein
MTETTNWKPIETYDGEDDASVIVFAKSWAQPSIAHKSEGAWYWDDFEDEIIPTHWMPLPEPPNET